MKKIFLTIFIKFIIIIVIVIIVILIDFIYFTIQKIHPSLVLKYIIKSRCKSHINSIIKYITESLYKNYNLYKIKIYYSIIHFIQQFKKSSKKTYTLKEYCEKK